MNKLAQLINNLSRTDLELIHRDLHEGRLQRLVDRRLTESNEERLSVCPTCGTRTHSKNAIRLEFGPPDLRQEAFFDGPDCIQFFLERHLRRQPNEKE